MNNILIYIKEKIRNFLTERRIGVLLIYNKKQKKKSRIDKSTYIYTEHKTHLTSFYIYLKNNNLHRDKNLPALIYNNSCDTIKGWFEEGNFIYSSDAETTIFIKNIIGNGALETKKNKNKNKNTYNYKYTNYKYNFYK